MPNRLTIAAAVVAASTLVLGGCASPAGPAQPSGSASTAQEKVALTLWTGFTGGDRPAYEALVTAFNDSHPNIQVTMEVQPWDTIGQKLPAAWATGQGPDLATPNFDPNVLSQYLKTNSLLPITATGTGDGQVDADHLAPAAIKAFTQDGKLYAVPANVATLQLYYNKALFTAAGIAEPPATVDEFRADAQKLTGNGVFGLSLADHETIQMWPILQWLDGSDIVDQDNCSALDSPEAIKSLTTWSKLVTDKVAPVGLSGAESDSLFSAGKAAMQLNGPWAAAGYTKAGIDLGVAPVPAGVNGTVTLGSTVPMAISAKTKYPAQAQEFLAWWTGKTAQQQFALDSGFPPVRTDMGDDPKLAANEVVAAFAAALPTARLYLPGVPNATKVDSDVYVTLIGQITRGEDVAKAAADASTKLNALTGCSK
jgi:ABC-type sugar transport system, periplasmic component